jgi:hypothetical protein
MNWFAHARIDAFFFPSINLVASVAHSLQHDESTSPEGTAEEVKEACIDFRDPIFNDPSASQDL